MTLRWGKFLKDDTNSTAHKREEAQGACKCTPLSEPSGGNVGGSLWVAGQSGLHGKF